jgi:hypothetical protein
MNRTLIAHQQIKERIEKWDYINLKIFCITKETVTRLKRQLTEWERIFSSYTFNNGLITRIYKNLRKVILQGINSPLNKWANELNR